MLPRAPRYVGCLCLDMLSDCLNGKFLVILANSTRVNRCIYRSIFCHEPCISISICCHPAGTFMGKCFVADGDSGSGSSAAAGGMETVQKHFDRKFSCTVSSHSNFQWSFQWSLTSLSFLHANTFETDTLEFSFGGGWNFVEQIIF